MPVVSQERWTRVDDYAGGLLAPHDEALDAARAASRTAGLPEIAVSPAQGGPDPGGLRGEDQDGVGVVPEEPGVERGQEGAEQAPAAAQQDQGHQGEDAAEDEIHREGQRQARQVSGQTEEGQQEGQEDDPAASRLRPPGGGGIPLAGVGAGRFRSEGHIESSKSIWDF